MTLLATTDVVGALGVFGLPAARIVSAVEGAL